MKKARENNLYRFLQDFRLTENAARSIKDILNFNLDMHLPQRKLAEMGQVISRIIAMEMVIGLGSKEFRQDLITNCLSLLRKEISSLTGNFRVNDDSRVVEDYGQDSSWMKFTGI